MFETARRGRSQRDRALPERDRGPRAKRARLETGSFGVFTVPPLIAETLQVRSLEPVSDPGGSKKPRKVGLGFRSVNVETGRFRSGSGCLSSRLSLTRSRSQLTLRRIPLNLVILAALDAKLSSSTVFRWQFRCSGPVPFAYIVVHGASASWRCGAKNAKNS